MAINKIGDNDLGNYKLIVSEPWDFTGPDGTNIINGEVIKELTDRCIIFESDQVLKFNQIQSKHLLLTSRYENQTLRNNNDYFGTVNGGVLFHDNFNAPIEVLEKKSKFVFIGRIEKI